ncbi:MAG: multifunctional CCA tRNA nucleotidyl transferase/2'3'-cyclic phosphodiesterase/2'nucleotidase/phosphatase [Gammaproteobacteria bacterium]|nr:multifunctional CCA tRNA nucleotidyl transferase/2'3'-cyclic phosphodiesterase/2'nucleotidase/phosphatase [Gammaproteobacteria bacterium]
MFSRYLVGGAVRDALLGRECKDRDWVVVGATPDSMRAAGYQLKDPEFQVYLHPQTGEEHVLARLEKKTQDGHRGFAVDFSPTTTLTDDLRRRDFTINAIAQDEQGTLIDPFEGLADLKRGIIKHVSPAFIDDPLRVWRGAQLAARLASHAFSIAPSTLSLMCEICLRQEFLSLNSGRIWLETDKAVAANEVVTYLSVLDHIGALTALISTATESGGRRGMVWEVRESIAQSGLPGAAQLIAFVLAFDPLADYDHGETLLRGLGAPARYHRLFNVTRATLECLPQLPSMTPEDFLHVLQGWDAFRRSERFASAMRIARIIVNAVTANRKVADYTLRLLEQGFRAAQSTDLSTLRDPALPGRLKKTRVTTLRCDAISRAWLECQKGA